MISRNALDRAWSWLVDRYGADENCGDCGTDGERAEVLREDA